MKKTNLDSCANPECKNEFKRLGEGKLFVRPAGGGQNETKQKAVWLCPQCAKQFDLRYDRHSEEYHLIRHRHVA